MNLKKLFLFILIGIVCSVSVVSAADINDTAVEIESINGTISVDDISIQKFEDNELNTTTDEAKNPVQSDNTTSDDVKINDCKKADCANVAINGLHFNFNAITAKDTQQGSFALVGGLGDWISSIPIGFKLLKTTIMAKFTGEKSPDNTNLKGDNIQPNRPDIRPPKQQTNPSHDNDNKVR